MEIDKLLTRPQCKRLVKSEIQKRTESLNVERKKERNEFATTD